MATKDQEQAKGGDALGLEARVALLEGRAAAGVSRADQELPLHLELRDAGYRTTAQLARELGAVQRGKVSPIVTTHELRVLAAQRLDDSGKTVGAELGCKRLGAKLYWPSGCADAVRSRLQARRGVPA